MKLKKWNKISIISLLFGVILPACSNVELEILNKNEPEKPKTNNPQTNNPQTKNPKTDDPKTDDSKTDDSTDKNNNQDNLRIKTQAKTRRAPKISEYSNFLPNKFNFNYYDGLSESKKPLIHTPKNYPQNLQTEFSDLFERKEVNGQYIINQNQIPKKTKRLQYNPLNRNFTTSASGVSFNTWDLEANDPKAYDTPTRSNTENTVPNDTYRKILRYSASLSVDNEIVDRTSDKHTKFTSDPGDLRQLSSQSPVGTAWILDYKIPNHDNLYPTTWFYATNLHVARALSLKNSYAPYQYDPKTNIITTAVKLRYYPIGNEKSFNALGAMKAGPTRANPNASQEVSLKSVKMLYTGMDFLKSKPHDFFPEWFEPDLEEFLDVAIFEVEFANERDAIRATQDYFHETNKWSFLNQSYLSKPTKLWKDPIFYSAGFPDVRNDWPSVATNKNPDENGFNDPSLDLAIQNQGSVFANTKMFSSFSNYEGILDSFLNLSQLQIQYWGKKLVVGGLSYAIRHDAMRPGSSGSMVINNQNQIIALHYADWDQSDTGLSAVLKSERFLYNNIPNYYVPDYDIIYGNGLDQKTSYREALNQAYASRGGIRTHLFPNKA